MTENIALTKPRLKVGALIHTRQDRTYIGTLLAGIEVNSPIRSVLDSMNGIQTCQEISATLNYPLSEMAALLMKLEAANLIDTEIGKISFHSRFHSQNAHRATFSGDDSNDGAFQQLKTKIAPELSFTTWLKGVRDGGVGIISARREVEIDIYGSTRIASLLFGILLSSGLSQTRIHMSEDRMIGEDDLCAGYLRSGDIGLSLASRSQELSRELSLFPLSASMERAKKEIERFDQKSSHNRIAIAVGNPPADLLQQWMSKGTPHLLIETPDAASVTIGPLVIPGQTPCARCITLAREEQGELWNELTWQKSISPSLETPVAVAHHVAGAIALELLRFIDSQNCTLQGARIRFDYHSPMQSERAPFARHPACGCSWTVKSAAS